MDIEEAVEIVRGAMDNIQDYDTTLGMYARAAVRAMGWRDLSKEVPAIDDVVVCTDGKARWLDKRTQYDRVMQWQGHLPTHWHPIIDLPVHSRELKAQRIEMDAQLKAKWVEALRSGEYKQGDTVLLRMDGRYCCLGVLSHIQGCPRERMLAKAMSATPGTRQVFLTKSWKTWPT